VTSRRLVAAFSARDPDRVGRFWAAVLDRPAVQGAGGVLLSGEDGQLSLRFFPGPAAEPSSSRMHVHLTSTDLADQQHTVARALGHGAQHLDVGQRPEEGHVVLADPEGNAFCVIEPGNKFLAGCGFLGELACDGSREVGLFWSRALGWPLVWDQDQETAIQSPDGGTKIAWGGPPLAQRVGRDRQRFDLVTSGDVRASEVDRLLALGATRLEVAAAGAVAMADPDGNEFCLTTD
jgi:catechol 2,3-dioxygenase-like lactoylglutathione lyase family enzyme